MLSSIRRRAGLLALILVVLSYLIPTGKANATLVGAKVVCVSYYYDCGPQIIDIQDNNSNGFIISRFGNFSTFILGNFEESEGRILTFLFIGDGFIWNDSVRFTFLLPSNINIIDITQKSGSPTLAPNEYFFAATLLIIQPLAGTVVSAGTVWEFEIETFNNEPDPPDIPIPASMFLLGSILSSGWFLQNRRQKVSQVRR